LEEKEIGMSSCDCTHSKEADLPLQNWYIAGEQITWGLVKIESDSAGLR